MSADYSPSIRMLYAWEIQEARRVFSDRLHYERVRIHECVGWPDAINRIGARLKGMEYTGKPNAITLGYRCYFPVRLLVLPVPVWHAEHGKLGWLIHELTHAWQFQHMGWGYLRKALGAQLKYGAQAYEYGGEQGLIEAQQKGWTLADFNLEQQGDIARYYYNRLCRGADVSAWIPYINDVQNI